MKELCDKATLLFKICMLFIIIYIVGTLVFSVASLGSVSASIILFEMLHSIAISTLISLCGIIVLDIDLRGR